MQDVHTNIVAAARNAGRDAGEITLLAVSKTFDAAAVMEAARAGQRDFGENYLQEALDKMAAVAALSGKTPVRAGADVEDAGTDGQDADEGVGAGPGPVPRAALDLPALAWHFIGPIQSNKTRPIAENFDWVHSVDRLKIAERLSDQRPARLGPLNICLQVNISGEASKSGVARDDVLVLARAVATLPNIRLRGLMAIPEPAHDFERQRLPLRQMHLLFEELRLQGLSLDCLSMGMSADMAAAIAEGATMVRIGSAIFGQRQAA